MLSLGWKKKDQKRSLTHCRDCCKFAIAQRTEKIDTRIPDIWRFPFYLSRSRIPSEQKIMF